MFIFNHLLDAIAKIIRHLMVLGVFIHSMMCLLIYTHSYCGSAGKESACYVGDLGLIPGLGRSPGEGNSYPLQYSGLENSMNCIVHEVTKSQT